MIRTACIALAAFATPALAGTNGLIFLRTIPTLDEIGLGVLVALVGVAAGWALRRRSATRNRR